MIERSQIEDGIMAVGLWGMAITWHLFLLYLLIRIVKWMWFAID